MGERLGLPPDFEMRVESAVGAAYGAAGAAPGGVSHAAAAAERFLRDRVPSPADGTDLTPRPEEEAASKG